MSGISRNILDNFVCKWWYLYTYFKIQANDSIIYGYIFIGSIDLMLKGKSLLDYTNLFSPNEYDRNNKIILTL